LSRRWVCEIPLWRMVDSRVAGLLRKAIKLENFVQSGVRHEERDGWVKSWMDGLRVGWMGQD
jgi:hypothetical protein